MNEDIRETIHSVEYDEYYAGLDGKTKAKYDYVEMIIKTQYVVNKKFVKNLEDTEFYKARVPVDSNEYRTIIFAVETLSFMESKRVLFLNSSDFFLYRIFLSDRLSGCQNALLQRLCNLFEVDRG